jgi:hypothetical protein
MQEQVKNILTIQAIFTGLDSSSKEPIEERCVWIGAVCGGCEKKAWFDTFFPH